MKTPSKLLTLGIAAIVTGALGWNAFALSLAPAFGPPTPVASAAGVGPEQIGCASASLTRSLTSLKQQLGITTAQQPAWDTYAVAVRDAITSLWTSQHDTAMNAMGNDSGMQAVMGKMHDQQRQTFQTLRTAADKLIAVLDDTQKQKAQTVLPGLASGGNSMLGMGNMMAMGAMMDMGAMD